MGLSFPFKIILSFSSIILGFYRFLIQYSFWSFIRRSTIFFIHLLLSQHDEPPFQICVKNGSTIPGLCDFDPRLEILLLKVLFVQFSEPEERLEVLLPSSRALPDFSWYSGGHYQIEVIFPSTHHHVDCARRQRATSKQLTSVNVAGSNYCCTHRVPVQSDCNGEADAGLWGRLQNIQRERWKEGRVLDGEVLWDDLLKSLPY